MLTLLCYRYKPTSEMTTSEMTTSETSQTSEKKHEASGCACELQDPQAHETKSARLGPRAQVLGELKDAEAATEAADSLDKISGWPEGGIASAGKNVDKMSGCARARLKWCSRSWTMSIRMSALTRACPRMPRARAPPSPWQGKQRENAKKERGVGWAGWCWCGARRRGQVT